MAVPSSIIPTATSSRNASKTRWSRVSGHWVKAFAANNTSPARSWGRPAMKSRITRFAAPSRSSGSKSRARMLPLMSSATTMSIPSPAICWLRCDTRGRARAITIKTIATAVSQGDSLRRRTRKLPLLGSNESREWRNASGWRLVRRCNQKPMATGTSNANAHGRASSITAHLRLVRPVPCHSIPPQLPVRSSVATAPTPARLPNATAQQPE